MLIILHNTLFDWDIKRQGTVWISHRLHYKSLQELKCQHLSCQAWLLLLHLWAEHPSQRSESVTGRELERLFRELHHPGTGYIQVQKVYTESKGVLCMKFNLKHLLTSSFHATLSQSAENTVIFTAVYLPTALILSYFQVYNFTLLIHCHSSDKDVVHTAFFNLTLTKKSKKKCWKFKQ